ncbi:MAG: Ig-like domain-containing protein [Candidatus Sulfotelmatobacter sp.]
MSLFVAQPIDDDSLWVADVNNDGKPDVVAASYYSYYPNGSCCSVAGDALVLLNNSGAPSTASSLASSLNPSVYGQAVTFIASVTSSAGAPTGTVTLYNRSTSVGTGALINGKASISVSSLPAGSNSITAVYPGSLSFLASTSAPLIQTVGIGSSTTLLTSSVNPAATGQRIRFLATVRGQYGGAATGTVTFVSGSQILGAPKLVAGQAAVGTSFATAGTHSITAYYSGDANNTASTSAILNQVVLTATTTTIGSSLNPSFVGQAVTFTSTVSSDAGSPPNGDVVTFRSGETVIGAALLTNGTASFSTSSLRAGTLTITAIYSGDTTFLTSTSSKLAQVVNKYATATALASSLGPSIYGQRVTFTATITGTGPVPPSGLVSFKWPGSTIGTAMLNSSGVATLTRSNLNADSYPLTATYVGDANNASSASAILDQVVTETTSAATLSSSLNPSTAGQAITFTATITSPTVIATGPVTFTAGKTVLGTAQLSKGKASFTTSTLAVGSTIVTATYYGDSNITKSSASVKQSVHQ